MSMIFDAHIHVGYFPRKDGKGGEAYYYSPARVIQYMRWGGVDEFIFSSMNACWDEHAETMHPEAMELKRLAKLNKMKAHPFFWVSAAYFDWDRNLEKMPAFYEGIKLHGGEGHWTEHPEKLNRILSIADERKFPVQIHTSNDEINGCFSYSEFCKNYSNVHFDLAHGHPTDEAIACIRKCDNVWIDCSFMETNEIEQIYAARPDRLMFGSDFPAPLRFLDESCTKYLRQRKKMVSTISGETTLNQNAMVYVNGN